MKHIVLLLSFAAVALFAAGLTDVAYAAEESTASSGGDGMKFLGAGIAFGVAALGAGIGSVISENPALQSKVFIFVGMVESIAIYGIVMMFIILGQ